MPVKALASRRHPDRFVYVGFMGLCPCSCVYQPLPEWTAFVAHPLGHARLHIFFVRSEYTHLTSEQVHFVMFTPARYAVSMPCLLSLQHLPACGSILVFDAQRASAESADVFNFLIACIDATWQNQPPLASSYREGKAFKNVQDLSTTHVTDALLEKRRATQCEAPAVMTMPIPHFMARGMLTYVSDEL